MDLISCQGAIDIALDEQESIPVKVQNHQTDPTSLLPLDPVNLRRSQAFQEKIPFFIFPNFSKHLWRILWATLAETRMPRLRYE